MLAESIRSVVAITSTNPVALSICSFRQLLVVQTAITRKLEHPHPNRVLARQILSTSVVDAGVERRNAKALRSRCERSLPLELMHDSTL